MPASRGSLRNWLARRKTSVVLALIAVLAGMILLNPLLFGLEASPNRRIQEGPTFYSTFTKNSFEITLHLSSYDEQKDQILPAPIEVQVTEIIPVASRRHCNESEFYDAVNRNPAASRHRTTSITRIRPPIILVKFNLPNDYNGQYACFRVVVRDANGESQRHFYASTQKITIATLVFDYDFDQGADASTMISNLKLRSYNGQQSQFWPTQTKIALQSALSASIAAEATCKSNHNREPALRGRTIIPNIQSLQWLQDPGSKRTFRLGRDLSYICYTIWIDDDGDGENWRRYFYAPASPLPRYYGQDTSAGEEEEGLSFNHGFGIYTDDQSRHSVYLFLNTYPINDPPTGRNPLVLNISTPLPVDKPSDCNLDPFADGFVLLAQEAEITSPQSVMATYYLRNNPQLSGKFACFLLVERENKQDKEVYFYAAFIETFDTADLPENWNLQEALKIFRRQLTAKGQNIAKDIDFKIDRNGCPSYSADAPVGGCWEASSLFGLKGGNIYVNDSLFPDNYASRTHIAKFEIIRKAVHVLTHELFHAIEDDRDDFAWANQQLLPQNRRPY